RERTKLLREWAVDEIADRLDFLVQTREQRRAMREVLSEQIDALTVRLSILRPAPEAERERLVERIAQLTAHRGCLGVEHDPANGKLHGYCVVCGVPWP